MPAGKRGPRARRKPLPARDGRANSPGDGKRSMALTAIMTVKKADVDTIMLKYAKLGVATGFAFDWGEYFDVTAKKRSAIYHGAP